MRIAKKGSLGHQLGIIRILACSASGIDSARCSLCFSEATLPVWIQSPGWWVYPPVISVCALTVQYALPSAPIVGLLRGVITSEFDNRIVPGWDIGIEYGMSPGSRSIFLKLPGL